MSTAIVVDADMQSGIVNNIYDRRRAASPLVKLPSVR